MENALTFPLRFFNFILLSSLMSTILVFIILTFKKIFGNKVKPSWHYLLWFILILRLILPWVPESSLSLFNILNFEQHTAIIQTTTPEEHSIQVKIVNPGTNVTELSKSNNQEGRSISAAQVNQSSEGYVQNFTINLKILYFIWLSVALIIGLCILLNSLIFEIKFKKHNEIVKREVFNIFLECKYKLNIYRNIPVIETPCVKSPTLVGFIYPRLLLPIDVLNIITVEQLNYVFLHELVHYKRKDIGVNLLISIILMFHWFNPVLWYAFYNMKEDQEISCDSLAISYINNGEIKEYALTLIKFLENFSMVSNLPATAGIGGGTKPQIVKRIGMIKSHKKYSLKWSAMGLVLIILLSMISLTNPKAGLLANKALASKPDNSAHEKQAVSNWLSNYSYRPRSQDEKSIANIITRYLNDVGNTNYRTVTGREGLEYLISGRQTQESAWIENTLSAFKKDKLIYKIDDVDIDFIFIHSDEATACLTGKISRISESNDLPNVYDNNFKALFNLKKIDGKWMIITTPQNDNLAEMVLLPSNEEKTIKKLINEYVGNNYNRIKNAIVFIPPITSSWPQIAVKCMITISRAEGLDSLNITYSEQEFTLQKIDDSWTIINNQVQNN